MADTSTTTESSRIAGPLQDTSQSPPTPGKRIAASTPTPEDLLLKFKALPQECDICELDDGELDWIELHATENLKARVATANVLAQEAHNTLLLTLTGTVGALAYAVELVDGKVTNSAVAAAAACIWLMFVSAFIVLRCMRVAPIPAVYYQPEALFERMRKGQTFEEWRTRTVLQMEKRIRILVERNGKVATALNRSRLAALTTPLIAGLTLCVTQLLCRGLQCY